MQKDIPNDEDLKKISLNEELSKLLESDADIAYQDRSAKLTFHNRATLALNKSEICYNL